MSDGKLYALLADEVCRDLLFCLLAQGRAMTQSGLVAATGLNSSTISRRMGELEDAGFVERSGKQAPYDVVFPETTRQLLLNGKELALAIADRESERLRRDIDALRGDPDRVRSAPESEEA